MAAEPIDLLVDDQGRVTLPDETRRELGIKSGDRVRLEIVSVASEMESESDAMKPTSGVALDEDNGEQPPSFLKHIGALALVNQLGDDEDFEDRIRGVMEDAAIQRYRRSL